MCRTCSLARGSGRHRPMLGAAKFVQCSGRHRSALTAAMVIQRAGRHQLAFAFGISVAVGVSSQFLAVTIPHRLLAYWVIVSVRVVGSFGWSSLGWFWGDFAFGWRWCCRLRGGAMFFVEVCAMCVSSFYSDKFTTKDYLQGKMFQQQVGRTNYDQFEEASSHDREICRVWPTSKLKHLTPT